MSALCAHPSKLKCAGICDASLSVIKADRMLITEAGGRRFIIGATDV